MYRVIKASEDDYYDPYQGYTYRIDGGNPYEENTNSYFTNDPVKAIELWFKMTRRWPVNTCIMCKKKSEAVALCRKVTLDLLENFLEVYKICPYRLDYMVQAAEEQVRNGAKSFYEGQYGYGDQIHPFSVG